MMKKLRFNGDWGETPTRPSKRRSINSSLYSPAPNIARNSWQSILGAALKAWTKSMHEKFEARTPLKHELKVTTSSFKKYNIRVCSMTNLDSISRPCT